jgi:tRNA splicing ligase
VNGLELSSRCVLMLVIKFGELLIAFKVKLSLLNAFSIALLSTIYINLQSYKNKFTKHTVFTSIHKCTTERSPPVAALASMHAE